MGQPSIYNLVKHYKTQVTQLKQADIQILLPPIPIKDSEVDIPPLIVNESELEGVQDRKYLAFNYKDVK